MPADTTITAMGLIHEALTQIARNRRWFLPIMGVIWLLQLPSFFGAENFIPLDAMELMGLPPGAASIIPGIIVMLAVYIGTAWSAVGWHRLRLLGEQPARVLPHWHARPVLTYFWVSIFLPLLTWGLPALLIVPVVVLLQALNAPMAVTVIAAIPAVIAAIWLSMAGPGSMTATSCAPRRKVLVPGPVRAEGLGARIVCSIVPAFPSGLRSLG